MSRLGTWVGALSLVAVWTANAVWGLPTLRTGIISIPKPKPPCAVAIEAWEAGRIELVARGSDADADFPRRPECSS